MATIYVRKTGSDTTGAGTLANPYLTIAKANAESDPYDTIDIGEGTFSEGVSISNDGLTFRGAGVGTIITGAGATRAFYASNADDITIQLMQLNGTVKYGVYNAVGNNWLLEDLTICNFGQGASSDQGGGVYLGSSSSNKATGCTLRRCIIYDCFSNLYGEIFGIKIDDCTNTIVEYCDIFLCAKAGIRVIRSAGTTIRYNRIHACWSGIDVNANVTDFYAHHNSIYHCYYGYNPKHAIGTSSSYVRFEYNTVEDCACNAIKGGGGNVAGDYWSHKYNLFIGGGRAFVSFEEAWVGDHIVVDYNCYKKVGSRPTYYYQGQITGDDTLYTTLAAAQAADPFANYETHGKDYAAGDELTYGSGAIPGLSSLTWENTIASAVSDSGGNSDNACDWKGWSIWQPGTQACWAVFDLGESQGFSRAILQPWGDDKDWSAKAIALYVSDSPSSFPGSPFFSATLGSMGEQNIMKFSTQVGRYVKLVVSTTQGGVACQIDDFQVGILSYVLGPAGSAALEGAAIMPAVGGGGEFTIFSTGQAFVGEGRIPAVGGAGEFTIVPGVVSWGGTATLSAEPSVAAAAASGPTAVLSRSYVPGRGRTEREIRDTGARLASNLRWLDRVWADVHHDTDAAASIATAYTVASVRMPAPPDGWSALVEGHVNVAWASGSALDALVAIETGTASIATAKAVVAAGSGAQSIRVSALWDSRSALSARLTVVNGTGRSTVDVLNAALVGRFVRTH